MTSHIGCRCFATGIVPRDAPWGLPENNRCPNGIQLTANTHQLLI